MGMTKKGRVLRDTSAGEGLVFVEGNQYPFRLEGMWRSEYAPKTNMAVDVDFDDAGKIIARPSQRQWWRWRGCGRGRPGFRGARCRR
jgi:hypothetical protein